MNSSYPLKPRTALALLAGFCAVACSPLQTINVLSSNSYYTATTDIAYGNLDRQSLDVYTTNTVRANAPVVIFFYGGGWNGGDKHDYEFVASSLTEAGYTVVIPDYRVFPEVVFPTFVEDGALSVAWVLNNAELVNEDQPHVFLMGHSAGAHIAALLSFDSQYLNDQSAATSSISGFVGLSGPYDFLPLETNYLADVFPEDLRADSQPINFVTSSAPPTLLVHGLDDKLVEPGNSTRLEQKLAESNIPVTMHLYEDVGHARVAVALSPPFEFTGDALKDTLRFLDSFIETQPRSRHP